MRIPAAIFFALPLLLAAASGAEAQNKCKDGTAATATGTIGEIQQFRPEPGVVMWDLTAQGKIGGNCQVERVWGNGAIPAGCTKGKKFTASGKALDADKFWMLQSDKLSCN